MALARDISSISNTQYSIFRYQGAIVDFNISCLVFRVLYCLINCVSKYWRIVENALTDLFKPFVFSHLRTGVHGRYPNPRGPVNPLVDFSSTDYLPRAQSLQTGSWVKHTNGNWYLEAIKQLYMCPSKMFCYHTILGLSVFPDALFYRYQDFAIQQKKNLPVKENQLNIHAFH